MELEMYRRYSQMARGIEKAELVFKNGRVFSSGTGEFIDGDVAVADGIVIGVGTYEGETEIDLEGKVICPGFIDSHLHLESTLVTPGELVRQAAQCGTTTFIVDPHESANVSGTDGIDYILDQTEDAPANVYVMMPSCVPATHVDDNGCILTAGKMKGYLEHPVIPLHPAIETKRDRAGRLAGSVPFFHNQKGVFFHGISLSQLGRSL